MLRRRMPHADHPRVLVTGGAGFIGANVALGILARHPAWEVLAVDNLRRRGSELNLARMRAAGVRFEHGDVRVADDLAGLPPVDVLVECSAEPSVLAGSSGGRDYVVQANLVGAYNCLEKALADSAQLIFLSTSRVYPVAGLEALRYREGDTRFELLDDQPFPGASADGVSEDFPLAGARTLYGATKLSAELLIAEYAAGYGLRTVINRCGVVAGPWQMGKIDQGVFTYWMLAHHFRRPLSYIGFGGSGKQVRDLLHVDDLVDLIDEQMSEPDAWSGRSVSLSLLETTELARRITGNAIDVEPSGESRPGDVPIYVSDCSALHARTAWRPRRDAERTLADIHAWIAGHEGAVAGAL
jgi:CDP-paratose 2-epimerase